MDRDADTHSYDAPDADAFDGIDVLDTGYAPLAEAGIDDRVSPACSATPSVLDTPLDGSASCPCGQSVVALAIPCPDPPFATPCRWQPIAPVPPANQWQQEVPGRPFSASDGIYVAIGYSTGYGDIWQYEKFDFSGLAPNTFNVRIGCNSSGWMGDLAYGHGELFGHDGLFLAPTPTGWSTARYGELDLMSCARAESSVGLTPPPPAGSSVSDLFRAVFPDGSFLYGWFVEGGFDVRHFTAEGAPVADTRTHPSTVSYRNMLRIGASVLIAGNVGTAQVFGMILSADGDVVVPEFAISQGPFSDYVWNTDVAPRIGLYSAHGEALVSFDNGSAVVLQTIALDGRTLGDPVLIPGYHGLEVARTPTGELLIEAGRGIPLSCVPL